MSTPKEKSRSRSRSRDRNTRREHKNRTRPIFTGLSNIIKDQKKFNKRLDSQELESANDKLKLKYPEQNITAQLLTEHLSKEQHSEISPEPHSHQREQEQKEDAKDRVLVCSYKQICQQRFSNTKDLMLHLAYHRAEEGEIAQEKRNQEAERQKKLKLQEVKNLQTTPKEEKAKRE